MEQVPPISAVCWVRPQTDFVEHERQASPSLRPRQGRLTILPRRRSLMHPKRWTCFDRFRRYPRRLTWRWNSRYVASRFLNSEESRLFPFGRDMDFPRCVNTAKRFEGPTFTSQRHGGHVWFCPQRMATS
eukprot:768689-Prorocentrum_minimum.AAC.3